MKIASTDKQAEGDRFDVTIVGAGPVGLTVANFLGIYGIRTLVVEQRQELIDYPRGVGMDDECLRTFQAVGLASEITRHTSPNQWLRFATEKGRIFASIEPRMVEFGWPRRNAFIQPLVDQILYKGLERFKHVEIRFGKSLESFEQDEDGVRLELESEDGSKSVVETSYLVGCDGGRSTVRKLLDIEFVGVTDSTKWIVIDLHDDPLGVPNSYFHCVPSRPFVSIALPHGLRRLEFMVFEHENEDELCSESGIQGLLSLVLPHPEQASVMRSRVYTHHARLAASFRKGRALIAGDAAHLMPVWQGQGYNSGIRDANNIAWKLAAVIKGQAAPDLLGTYEDERRSHAAAMISISQLAGKIFSPTNRFVAAARNFIALALNMIPPVKRYVVQMRFKPMPQYTKGAILPTKAGAKEAGNSPVGRLFIQPKVQRSDGVVTLLDDVIGPEFAVIAWGVNPAVYMDEETLAFWKGMNARLVEVKPTVQMEAEPFDPDASEMTIGDAEGRFHDWFSSQSAGSVIVMRPDRFVAAVVMPQQVCETSRELASAMHAPYRTGAAVAA